MSDHGSAYEPDEHEAKPERRVLVRDDTSITGVREVTMSEEAAGQWDERVWRNSTSGRNSPWH